MSIRIAAIVSHPIQHFCPQYVSLAQNENVEFKVFFGSMLGLRKYVDPDFKQEISWGNLGLDQFNHEFLNGEKIIPSDKNLDAASLDFSLDEFSPDIIITYGYFQKLQRRAHRWARNKKVPIAYISDSEQRHKKSILREFIKYPYLRWYFSRINFFLIVGNANEEFYRHFGVSTGKFIRMHFPIDLNVYQKAYADRSSLKDLVRKKYDIAANDFVICVVGKLVPWKNQDHLIDAVLKLEAKGSNLHLFILGSGSQMENLELKAKALKNNKVYFPGFVDTADLPSFYAAIDVYVHPASVEPHSIAISEAIYMGCPIIISDRCGSYGTDDDVQEGKNGLIYPFGNIDMLVDRITWMIQHPRERIEFGEVSHQLAVQYQHRAHVEFMNDLIKKIRVGKITYE